MIREVSDFAQPAWGEAGSTKRLSNRKPNAYMLSVSDRVCIAVSSDNLLLVNIICNCM